MASLERLRETVSLASRCEPRGHVKKKKKKRGFHFSKIQPGRRVRAMQTFFTFFIITNKIRPW